MTLALVDRRRRSIRSHLFLLCPNNSGSTYLSAAIRRSRRVWGFDSEGQHVVGFAGPHTQGSRWALIWGSTPEARLHFEDGEYDWGRTKKAWYFHASSAHEDSPVFFTKSPPFLLIAEQLRDHFEDTRFLIMVRDPYATLEGITRRYRPTGERLTRSELVGAAARHLVTCFERQRCNIERFREISCVFTYEDLCADPAGVAGRINALLPELDDLDLSQRLAVKGIYDEPLRNMNAQQVDRLSDADLDQATAMFAPHREHFEAFGYKIDAAAARVSNAPTGR